MDRYLEEMEGPDARELRGATWAVYEGATQQTSGGKFWCRVWSLWHYRRWLPVKTG